jgi:hypothetical protein
MGWPTETLIGPSSRWVCLRPPRSGMRCPRPIGVRQRYRISSRRRVPAHFAFPTNCFQLPLSCSLFMFDLCEVNPALLTASTCFNTPLRATKSWSRTPIGSVVGSPVRSSTARRCPEIMIVATDTRQRASDKAAGFRLTVSHDPSDQAAPVPPESRRDRGVGAGRGGRSPARRLICCPVRTAFAAAQDWWQGDERNGEQ